MSTKAKHTQTCNNAEFQPREPREPRVRGSVVGPFSHVAILLSCVVSSEFKQLIPAHKEHIQTCNVSNKRRKSLLLIPVYIRPCNLPSALLLCVYVRASGASPMQ